MSKAICVIALDTAQAAGLAALISSALGSGSPIADLMRTMGVDNLLRYIGPGGIYTPNDPSECQEHTSVDMMSLVMGDNMPGGKAGAGNKKDPTDVVQEALKKAAESGTNVVGFPGKDKPPAADDTNPGNKEE